MLHSSSGKLLDDAFTNARCSLCCSLPVASRAGSLQTWRKVSLEEKQPHFFSLTPPQHPLSRLFLSEEEEEDEEESDDETRELVLQSSSLHAVDEEKDLTDPPAKQPRMSLNLQ